MIALYSRVSTQEQAEHGYSLEEQNDRLNKYCDAMGWKARKLYSDPGFSGANTNRPALQSLIRDIKNGKVEKVLVYKLDRLSRSQKDTLMLIEDVFLANHCDFISMSENFDTSTAFGRAMLGILSCFSQLERESIKERMSMGRTARAKTGQFMGSYHLPIGYDRVDGKLVPNEFEAMLVNRIFDEFIAGKTLNRIAEGLNADGLFHKNGRKWFPTSIYRILTYKTYIGYVNFKGEWFKGIHEPIMSEEKFNTAARLYEQRKEASLKTGRKHGKATSYLGGFLFCKRCGAKYAKTGRVRDNWTWNAYVCNTKGGRDGKGNHCDNLTWKMAELDELVFDEVRKLLLQDVKPKPRSNKEKNLIIKQIESYRTKIDRLMDLYANGNIPIEQLQDKIRSLNDQKTKLESNLERLENEEEQITQSDIADLSKTFSFIMENGSFEEIRSVLDALIEKIEIDGENITIYWRFS